MMRQAIDHRGGHLLKWTTVLVSVMPALKQFLELLRPVPASRNFCNGHNLLNAADYYD